MYYDRVIKDHALRTCPLTVTALDTHAVVKELKAAGFCEEQAEAVTSVVRRSQDVDLSNLVTKSEFQLAMAAAKADLAETKAEILKWMVGSMGVQTIVILGTVAGIVRILLR